MSDGTIETKAAAVNQAKADQMEASGVAAGPPAAGPAGTSTRPAPRVYSLDVAVPGTIPVLTAPCWEPPGTAAENVLRQAESLKRAGVISWSRPAPIYLRNFLYANGLADSAIDWTRGVQDGLTTLDACRRTYWTGWAAMFFATIHDKARVDQHPILLQGVMHRCPQGELQELVLVQCENHRSPFKVPPAGVRPGDRLHRHTVQRLADLGMRELRDVIRASMAWPAPASGVAAYEMADFSAAATDWNGWRLPRCAPGDIDSPSAQIRWSAGKGDEAACTNWAIEILRACTQRRIVAWIGPGGIGEKGEYWAPDWWPRALRRIVEAGREIGVEAWPLWRPNAAKPGEEQVISRDLALAARIVNEVGGAA